MRGERGGVPQRPAIFEMTDEELRSLPTKYRFVMESIRTGANYSKVARQLGIQLGTVKSRLSRAKEMVRKERDRRVNAEQVKLLNSIGR